MYLLLDIGGTNTRLALSPDDKKFNEPVIKPTPQNFNEAIQLISQTTRELTGQPIQAAAIGLPGPLDPDKTKTMGSHKLPDWKNKPIKQELEKTLAAPVFLENDSALVGLGEATTGAGRGYSIVAYLTISTGVGGARIVDGKIDRHSLGFEPGWQVMDIDGTVCNECPSPHRLEHLIGGAQVEKRFHCHPKEIDDPQVWNQMAKWLALALNNTLVYWSPDIIILGGPMMRDIPINKVRDYLEATASFLPEIPPVEPASLGDLGGLHGGLALLQSQQTKTEEQN